MGGNRGWWNQSENTPAEKEAKYQWREVGQIDGVKVLENKKNKNAALPRFSNTPNTMYLHQNSKGRIDQLRVFRGRNSFFDIDWGHGHGSIPRGVPHIQEWKYTPKTKTLTRVDNVRPMSPYMWKKYGPIIMKADPTVRRK